MTPPAPGIISLPIPVANPVFSFAPLAGWQGAGIVPTMPGAFNPALWQAFASAAWQVPWWTQAPAGASYPALSDPADATGQMFIFSGSEAVPAMPLMMNTGGILAAGASAGQSAGAGSAQGTGGVGGAQGGGGDGRVLTDLEVWQSTARRRRQLLYIIDRGDLGLPEPIRAAMIAEGLDAWRLVTLSDLRSVKHLLVRMAEAGILASNEQLYNAYAAVVFLCGLFHPDMGDAVYAHDTGVGAVALFGDSEFYLASTDALTADTSVSDTGLLERMGEHWVQANGFAAERHRVAYISRARARDAIGDLDDADHMMTALLGHSQPDRVNAFRSMTHMVVVLHDRIDQYPLKVFWESQRDTLLAGLQTPASTAEGVSALETLAHFARAFAFNGDGSAEAGRILAGIGDGSFPVPNFVRRFEMFLDYDAVEAAFERKVPPRVVD